jgi:hypothetical protein
MRIKYPSETGLALLARNFGDQGDAQIDMMFALDKLGIVRACGQLCFFNRDEYLPFLADVFELDSESASKAVDIRRYMDGEIDTVEKYNAALIVVESLENQNTEGRLEEITDLFKKHFDLSGSALCDEEGRGVGDKDDEPSEDAFEPLTGLKNYYQEEG